MLSRKPAAKRRALTSMTESRQTRRFWTARVTNRSTSSMPDHLPLSALLSQALVAFTIEFDNEFEHQTPHRTANYGSTPGSSSPPWLVSMVMWIRLMRFVPDEGITLREFQSVSVLTSKEMKWWLTRMSKWRYVIVDKNAAEDPFRWIIRPTSGGQKALQVWRPLDGIIERRWHDRFGNDAIAELRQSMESLANQFNPELPDYLPILGYEMMSRGPDPDRQPASKLRAASAAKYSVPMLLSKVLLALAIQYESESGLSLAISANVLRVTSEEGTCIRDLPRLSGVSKEAIAMVIKRLEKRGLAIVRPEAKGSRLKALFLTTNGQQARDTYHRLPIDIEKRWEARFGQVVIDLKRSLKHLVRESPGGKSCLFEGLEPHPDCWRASVRKPEVLPHHPMVLHRGGFPDGS